MPERELRSQKGRSIEELQRETFEKRPQLQEWWDREKSRRDLAFMLLKIRTEAKLTQSTLAEKLGWDQPRVSRMESVTGPEPTLSSVGAYARACGYRVEHVFAGVGGDVAVTGGVELDPEVESQLAARMQGDAGDVEA